MQFLMLICKDPLPPNRSEPADGDVASWVSRMDERGIRLAGGPVASDDEATTVRVRTGDRQINHGSVMKTSGTLLGFDLLECGDLDEALDVAAEHPLAARYVLELRRVESD